MFYACFTSIPCLACQISTFFCSLQPASGLQCICRKNSVQFDQDNDFMSWNSSFRIKNSQEFLLKVILFTPLFLSSMITLGSDKFNLLSDDWKYLFLEGFCLFYQFQVTYHFLEQFKSWPQITEITAMLVLFHSFLVMMS